MSYSIYEYLLELLIADTGGDSSPYKRSVLLDWLEYTPVELLPIIV